MAITLAQLSAPVLRLVQKESTYQGFFTVDKVNDAINDSIDFISSIMMQNGEGWLRHIDYLTTVANTATVALPPDCSVIHAVRYLISNYYMPLTYDDQAMRPQTLEMQQTQFPTNFRLMGGNIYFNPVPGEVGTDYVQIEYSKYPTALANQNDQVNDQFDRAMLNYIKWRAASQLVSQVGKGIPEWTRYENEWYSRILDLVSKRIRVKQYIKDFDAG